jgi:hypothetical protein
MNKVFAEHVTSTAFFLSISKKQMKYLLHVADNPFSEAGEGSYYGGFIRGNGLHDPDTWATSMPALERKGLVARVVHDKAKGYGHYELTRAGELTCDLLREAGLAPALRVAMRRAA